MKKSLIGLVLFLAIMALPMAAHAQGKIGVINLKRDNRKYRGRQEGQIADFGRRSSLPANRNYNDWSAEIQEMTRQTHQAGSPMLSDDEQRRLSTRSLRTNRDS